MTRTHVIWPNKITKLTVDNVTYDEGGKVGKTTLTGTLVGVDVTATQKIWRSFQAVGDIAFAYAYATVLIEIQAS